MYNILYVYRVLISNNISEVIKDKAYDLLSMKPWAAAKKKLLVSVAVPPTAVWVPSQKSLSQSVASITSVANDKGDNEMILGLCINLLAFALQPRKPPENLS